MAVAGVASGLASPALARVVELQVATRERSAVQTWVNSGTSVGLAVSAPTVLLATSWRATWVGFAVASIAVAGLAAATRSVQAAAPADTSVPVGAGASGGAAGPSRLALGEVDRRLLGASVTLGATSAAYWAFSVQRLEETGLGAGWTTAFWVTLGLVGLVGGSAGELAGRVGLGVAVRRWALVWAAGLAALALPVLPGAIALVSAAAFGAAFMALTGLAIVWSSHVFGDAAAGVRACFLALGIGQAVGTPLAGALGGAFGAHVPFLVSAVVSLLLLSPWLRAERSGVELPRTGATRPGGGRAARLRRPRARRRSSASRP